MLLPVQFALTAQFAAFTFMYFADTRAATRGWTPPWYSTYRFVLTFIVGSALLISLIGREKIGDDKPRLTGLREKFHKEGHDTKAQHEWDELEEKEREKNRKKKALEEKKKKLEEERQQLEDEEKEAETSKDDGKKAKGSKSGSKDKSKGAEKDESKDDGKEEDSDESKEDDKADEKDGDADDKQEGKGAEEKQDDKSE